MPLEAATAWAGEEAAVDAVARAACWAPEMAERHLAVGTDTSWHGCACCWTA